MYQMSGFSCGLQSVQNLRTQGMIIVINYNVVDIRYVQLEPTFSWALLCKELHGTSKYTGMLQAAKKIYKEGGLTFTVLHKLKMIAVGSSKAEFPKRFNIFTSTIATNPFDFLTCMICMQVHPNMRSVFASLIKYRGFRGLYDGLTPTLVEIIPYAGLQFEIYDTFKRWYGLNLRFASVLANFVAISLFLHLHLPFLS
ncbi:hypothetical protein DCAR_0520474 [Daucus carota subsp. sativus]|uniref:Uncharacterized protein n=1 Tax=Daucus carota subsp. sativus TaxID=79200 RepID=A0AAF0X453_DAUCS|nr:hypothetical protein DCAR_0520474 [Daucus carota subsp. sativus]